MAALYQRARPITFAEVVGQEHVKDVLSAAVTRERTGHAYLFSGPRGVGKTTTARLLAMAVNCEFADPAGRPCGECESCRLVQSGSHPDVAELDAASNNSVEDVRDLRERVGLASLRGGKRVWILDEAHMLSKAAANALLKTLEEPPPGLVFVLATTEPEKLPATILSRCQHFRFRRLTDDEIASKLTRLCEEAGVEADPDALALVARAADGGMRDAESLLDRLLVAGTRITSAAAEDALGLPPRERLAALADALLGFDLERLLALAGDLYRAGYAPRTIAEQLGRTLRDRLHELLGGTSETAFGDERGDAKAVSRRGEGRGDASAAAGAPVDPAEQERLVRLIHALDDEHDRFSRRNDLYSLEVALIKAGNALRPQATAVAAGVTAGTAPAVAAAGAVPAAGASADSGKQRPAPAAVHASDIASDPAPAEAAAASTEGGRADAATPADTSSPTGRHSSAQATQAPTPSQSRPSGKPFSWHAVKSAAGPQLKAFLQPAAGADDGTVLSLTYDERYKFHYEQLLGRREELESLIESVAGPGYTLSIVGPGGRAGGAPKKA